LKKLFTTTDDAKLDRNTVPSPCLSASPNFKFGLPHIWTSNPCQRAL